MLPLWWPIIALADLVRRKRRIPTVRLLSFAVGWAWLELIGVVVTGLLWTIGRAGDVERHAALQRWWAASLMTWLRTTTGITVVVKGIDALRPGPVVLLCRHASLADSLVSAWVVTSLLGMRPRYVLKRELLADPCLDIVGNRMPNHFLDRHATDSTPELAALTALGRDMADHEVAVIFPEGTRASPAKRDQVLERIAASDPERASRLRALRHLLPPRPAGSAALLDGAAGVDVVLAWHIGFDGLDTFGGMLRHLEHRPAPVRFVARRIPRSSVPSGDAFGRWLDDRWLEMDDAVDALLRGEPPTPTGDPSP